MSNFAEKRMRREKQEKHDSERRTALSKFLYNLALACFTIMVLSNATTLIAPKENESGRDCVAVVALGIVITLGFSYIANKTMKK